MKLTRLSFLFAVALMTTIASAQTDTTFTYQGELRDNGNLVTGSFNIDFLLWDALSSGNQIGLTDSHTAAPVVDGKFTVELDFGAETFDNSDRWLEINVEGFTLAPRQPITRTPYAIQTRGITVDDNYNVGIGTLTPEATLHVQATTNATLQLDNDLAPDSYVALRDASSTQALLQKFNNSGSVLLDIDPIPLDGASDAQLRFFRSVNTTGLKRVAFYRGNNTTQTSALIGLDGADSYFQIQGGNVGIGTATPDYKLHVESTDETAMVAHTTNSEPGKFPIAISGSADGDFSTGVKGTGTAIGVSGQANGTSGLNAGIYGFSNSTSGRGVNGVANASSGENYGVYGQSNSPDGFDFYAIGAGQDYGSGSSRRWKSNIVEIGRPLKKISQLRGVYFDWDAKHGGQLDVGMIAEEVGMVLPEIVQYEANGVDAIGMDYSKLTPLLVEAVKALRREKNAEITELKQQNDSLQQANDDLLSRLEVLERRVTANQQENPK